jgi:hypothetical protein
MTRIYPSFDRLEARIDHQAARIDELYRLLEVRGIIPAPDEPDRAEDAPVSRERLAGHPLRRATTLHVGEATGV